MRGIYKITNTINNKCYIGKSENLPDRIKYHIKSLISGNNKNIHMQNAYNKYGENSFTIEILEILNEEDDINEREKFWISFYNSNNEECGYNRTEGGDGGNSYVDSMTKEEKEEHYQKHRNLRLGEKNSVYGKHLYHNGLEQKFLSDDEVEEYVENGWIKGANDKVKKEKSDRYKGENNPFYGKKHSKETIENIKKTKEKNNSDTKGYKRYYKDGVIKYIQPNEIDMYENNGWVNNTPNEICQKISDSKRKNFNNPEWVKAFHKNRCIHYKYMDIDFYGINDLIYYLKQNGYPTISKSTIRRFNKKMPTNKYKDLFDKLQIVDNKEE